MARDSESILKFHRPNVKASFVAQNVLSEGSYFPRSQKSYLGLHSFGVVGAGNLGPAAANVGEDSNTPVNPELRGGRASGKL